MIARKFVHDESAITISVETILLFSISIILLGLIIQSFLGLNQKQNKILMQEEYLTVGNGIAKQMSEMTVEAMASLATGSNTTIRSEIYMPAKIADTTYSARMKPGKLIIESSSDPYVSVEIPLNTDIILAENSTIYSYDETPVLEYDSKSGSIYFVNGGVIPPLDYLNPNISILSPPNGTTITNITRVNVSVQDNVRVTRVEYYIDGVYEYTTGSPYNWTWDTTTMFGGNYTVTAVAYDTAGNSAAASHSYFIDNGAPQPPVITVLSPTNDTDFRKPKIQVRITDGLGIDFGSIIFKVDNVDQISNVTFVNVSSRNTTVTYIPAQNMDVSGHDVRVDASNIIPLPAIPANWSFLVLPISDTNNPTTSIVLPDASTVLSPGQPIRVTYTAADNISGIDNISIKVTRGDGETYFHNDTISVYPTVTYTLPPTTWSFTELYAALMNYTYSITVHDRNGNTASATAGPYTVGAGMAAKLDVNTGSLRSTGNLLERLKLKDLSYPYPVIITGVNVSWDSAANIDNVAIESSTNYYWTSGGIGIPAGQQNSGTNLTFGSTYQAKNAAKNMEITLTGPVANRIFTIVFYLQDTTSKTVTFTAPP